MVVKNTFAQKHLQAEYAEYNNVLIVCEDFMDLHFNRPFSSILLSTQNKKINDIHIDCKKNEKQYYQIKVYYKVIL